MSDSDVRLQQPNVLSESPWIIHLSCNLFKSPSKESQKNTAKGKVTENWIMNGWNTFTRSDLLIHLITLLHFSLNIFSSRPLLVYLFLIFLLARMLYPSYDVACIHFFENTRWGGCCSGGRASRLLTGRVDGSNPSSSQLRAVYESVCEWVCCKAAEWSVNWKGAIEMKVHLPYIFLHCSFIPYLTFSVMLRVLWLSFLSFLVKLPSVLIYD